MTMTSEDFDRMYGSKYLGAPDVGNGLRLRIGKVETADLREKDGNTKRRIVVWFEGQDKGLVINKTNAIKLADAYGKNSAAWLNQVVELYTEDRIGKTRRSREAAAPAIAAGLYAAATAATGTAAAGGIATGTIRCNGAAAAIAAAYHG
jgi:hypothetical protein